MEIAEFLLARIAEDEEPTWTLYPYECPPGCCAPEGWVGAQCRYCDAAPVYGGTVAAITDSVQEHAEVIHQRSRVLAECEAKRRIVEYTECFPQFQIEEILGALAMPYADHPDFREEWRVFAQV